MRLGRKTPAGTLQKYAGVPRAIVGHTSVRQLTEQGSEELRQRIDFYRGGNRDINVYLHGRRLTLADLK
jgi:hypothetical protein